MRKPITPGDLKSKKNLQKFPARPKGHDSSRFQPCFLKFSCFKKTCRDLCWHRSRTRFRSKPSSQLPKTMLSLRAGPSPSTAKSNARRGRLGPNRLIILEGSTERFRVSCIDGLETQLAARRLRRVSTGMMPANARTAKEPGSGTAETCSSRKFENEPSVFRLLEIPTYWKSPSLV